jgi:hypothetical protein
VPRSALALLCLAGINCRNGLCEWTALLEMAISNS